MAVKLIEVKILNVANILKNNDFYYQKNKRLEISHFLGF